MALRGEFKTAYLQHEVVETVAVVGDMVVGQLVTYVPATTTVQAYIKTANNVDDATHIIAQSDMTMEYGHVPVENRDYRYSEVVAKTTATTPTTLTGTKKKVAMFNVYDVDDIVTTTI